MYVSISLWVWVCELISIRHEICAPVPSSLSLANTNGTAPITLEVLVIFEATHNPWPMLKVVGGYLNEDNLKGRQVGFWAFFLTSFNLGLLVVHGFSVCRGHWSLGVLTHVHKQVQWSRQLNIFRWISPVDVSGTERQTNCWYIKNWERSFCTKSTDKDNTLPKYIITEERDNPVLLKIMEKKTTCYFQKKERMTIRGLKNKGEMENLLSLE
jgi:hypothetical protein